MKKALLIIVAVSLIAGCGGRAANLVAVTQYGDQDKSCSMIADEVSFIDSEVSRLLPETKKAGNNFVAGVAGVFFILPWLLIDLSQAEQQEINALQQRRNYLAIIDNEKNCNLVKAQVLKIVKKPIVPVKNSDEW